MMAVKNWSDGNVVYSNDFDEVVNSTCMRFPDAATRNAVLVGDLAPTQGMMCHLVDQRRTYQYTVVSGTGYWAPLPGTTVALLQRNASLPVTTASAKVAFDVAPIDLFGGWSAGAPTRYTVKVPGRYLIGGGIGYAADATGSYRVCYVYVNNASQADCAGTMYPAGAAISHVVVRPGCPYLNVNDYVEIGSQHNATASIDIGGGKTSLVLTYAGLG